MASFTDLRQIERAPTRGGRARVLSLAALLAGGAASVAFAFFAASSSPWHSGGSQPAFLERALGPRTAGVALRRTLPGRVRIAASGHRFSATADGSTVGLSS